MSAGDSAERETVVGPAEDEWNVDDLTDPLKMSERDTEHAATVLERLEGRFGDALQPEEPPAGEEHGVVRRLGEA